MLFEKLSALALFAGTNAGAITATLIPAFRIGHAATLSTPGTNPAPAEYGASAAPSFDHAEVLYRQAESEIEAAAAEISALRADCAPLLRGF